VLDLLKRRLEARGWPLPFLAITGGEPLVRKDLSEVMHVAFRELGYTWGMTSNGVALSPGTAARLAQAGMSTVSVSLDGYGATHDTQRNAPGSYETTMANLINMTKNRVFKRIQVTTVVNPHNMDELETLHAVLLPLGLTSWRLASTDPIGRADESLMLTGAQHRELFEFIVSHSDERLPIIYACPSHLGEYEQRVRDHPFHCSAGQETMSILHNGDVAACPNIPAHDDTIQGNIYDQDINLDILEVWDTRYHFHRNRDIMFSEFCDACDVWDACRGGSRHSFDFEARTQRKCIKKMLDFERERGR
jgi:radical SAM protein with 4Fe4S-binding SPASM domain